MAARLEHEDGYVRRAAAEALGGQSNLPEAILTAVAARLEDEDGDVRRAAPDALGGQSNLPEAILTAVAARLEDEDAVYVRRAAADALGGQSNLPEAILTAVAARLEDEDGDVKKGRGGRARRPIEPTRGDPHGRGGPAGGRGPCTSEGPRRTRLGGQSNLPEAILTAVAARLEDEDVHVKKGRGGRLARPIEPTRGDPHGRGGPGWSYEDRGRSGRARPGGRWAANRTCPKGTLAHGVVAHPEHEDMGHVQTGRPQALRGQSSLPEGILTRPWRPIWSTRTDDVRSAAVHEGTLRPWRRGWSTWRTGRQEVPPWRRYASQSSLPEGDPYGRGCAWAGARGPMSW